MALAVCISLAAAEAGGQTIPIGIIDFYGLGGVSADRARTALTFKEVGKGPPPSPDSS